MEFNSEIGTILAAILLCAVYVVPSVIAVGRRHHQTLTILVLNVLFGWTVFGWIVAIVWALGAIPPEFRKSTASRPAD